MEVCGELHALAALLLGREHRYTLCRNPDGPQIRTGCCGEDKHLLLLLGIKLRPFSHYPFAILSALFPS
jgi:hypothetical protein